MLGMSKTPNTETNMDLDLNVDSNSLAGLLQHVNINGQIDPVKVMFDDQGATIWAHDVNKTLQVFIDSYEMEDYDLKSEPGCIVLETKKVAEMLQMKFKGRITLKASAGKPCTFTDSSGSSLTYYPPSEDECYVVPDHWVLPVNADGMLTFPMLKDAESTLRVTLHPDELRKALIDMRTAGATYACIEFEKNESISTAGHWTAKANTSRTVVDADIKVGSGSVTFPEVLAAVSDRIDGDVVEIQKHDDAPFFLLSSEVDSTRILVTEAQRAENA